MGHLYFSQSGRRSCRCKPGSISLQMKSYSSLRDDSLLDDEKISRHENEWLASIGFQIGQHLSSNRIESGWLLVPWNCWETQLALIEFLDLVELMITGGSSRWAQALVRLCKCTILGWLLLHWFYRSTVKSFIPVRSVWLTVLYVATILLLLTACRLHQSFRTSVRSDVAVLDSSYTNRRRLKAAGEKKIRTCLWEGFLSINRLSDEIFSIPGKNPCSYFLFYLQNGSYATKESTRTIGFEFLEESQIHPLHYSMPRCKSNEKGHQCGANPKSSGETVEGWRQVVIEGGR